MRAKFLRSFFAVVFLLISAGFISCTGLSDSPFPEKPKANSSPSDVVGKFLDALKSEDFATAFDYIYTPFSDREGYVARMKGVSADYKSDLISYRMLGTQLLGRNSIVVAELEVTSNSGGANARRKVRNQYNLTIIDKDWKITSDKCILNCVGGEQLPKPGESQ